MPLLSKYLAVFSEERGKDGCAQGSLLYRKGLRYSGKSFDKKFDLVGPQ